MSVLTKATAKRPKKAKKAPVEQKPRLQQYEIRGWTVYEAALERIRWLFDEFDNDIAVASSGGKDSTVIVELASIVNKERGLPPLRVVWLDQECEFQATVDYQRYLAYERDDIDFHWYQIPFRLENATNSHEPFLEVWDESDPSVWVREKEPIAFTKNEYGHDHFYKLLSDINAHTARAVLTGMRADESLNRRIAVTSTVKYKWVTWATKFDGSTRDQWARYRFHPIYDWSTTDIWKAIHDHGWRYNAHYDAMYQHGVPTHQMRVSNYHHETAIWALSYLQEVEPETWEKATKRLPGINTYGHLGRDQYVKELPYMFSSWDEYALHLIENLITDEDGREKFLRQRAVLAKQDYVPEAERGRALVNSIITGDRWGTLVHNFSVSRARLQNQTDKDEVIV